MRRHRPDFALQRRHLIGLLGLAELVGLAALGGCGFALRQTPPLPFSRIAMAGFVPRSPLGAALRASLAASAQVVDTPGQAEVVLHALIDRREKSVVASTAVGQVRELQLRVRFAFRLATPGGRELVPATELMLSRDMSYTETNALAKAQEEAEIYAAMQSDIVQQVLRRLAQVNPTPGAAASAPRG
jgi:LPS-assembly lipoprotein